MLKAICRALDEASPYVGMAGMAVPPWNIFWWIVGYCLFCLGRKDANGARGIAAMCLPGLMAELPLVLLQAGLERLK